MAPRVLLRVHHRAEGKGDHKDHLREGHRVHHREGHRVHHREGHRVHHREGRRVHRRERRKREVGVDHHHRCEDHHQEAEAGYPIQICIGKIQGTLKATEGAKDLPLIEDPRNRDNVRVLKAHEDPRNRDNVRVLKAHEDPLSSVRTIPMQYSLPKKRSVPIRSGR
jgi:hypothetical protein